ncbi:MAG TPA: YafY family protein [Chloroflexota bacterium]|nr:YafY family protein [Chloroflexota bacterium]
MAITLLLQARGKMTAERLADILGVSVRTVYRDMNSLSLAHVPVSMDHGPGGGYFLPDDSVVGPIAFTGEEALALALGRSVVGDSSLFGGAERLQQALIKLEAALPEEYRRDVRVARERILVDSSAWHRRPEAPRLLDSIRQAVWEGRRITILYPRSERPGSDLRPVDPYGLVYKAGIWYLVAYCHLRRDFRIFHLSRIEAQETLGDPITPRPDFNLAGYWEEARQRFEEQTAPVTVTLRITADGLSGHEGEWTVLETDPAGRTTVLVSLESIDAAVAYVLSFGPNATVLGPPDVLHGVAEAARELYQLYSRSTAEI